MLTTFEEFISRNIAKVINSILLSLVYLLILIPIGLLKKIFSPRIENNSFELMDKTYNKDNLKNPW